MDRQSRSSSCSSCSCSWNDEGFDVTDWNRFKRLALYAAFEYLGNNLLLLLLLLVCWNFDIREAERMKQWRHLMMMRFISVAQWWLVKPWLVKPVLLFRGTHLILFHTRKPSWRKGYARQRRNLVNALKVRQGTFAIKVEFVPPLGECI